MATSSVVALVLISELIVSNTHFNNVKSITIGYFPLEIWSIVTWPFDCLRFRHMFVWIFRRENDAISKLIVTIVFKVMLWIIVVCLLE